MKLYPKIGRLANPDAIWESCSVRRQNPLLARAIMLALLAGSAVPATGLATTFQGVKFNDLNGDGVQNPGEKGVPYETIFFRYGDTDFSNVTTDMNGLYSVSIPTSATTDFVIWSGIPSDWQQTTPVKGEGMAIYMLTEESNASLEINFGIWNGIKPPEDNIIVNAGLNQAIEVGDKVQIKASFTDTQASDNHHAVIDFGDGNTAVRNISATSSSTRRAARRADQQDSTTLIEAQNTYMEAGTFETTVTITNAQGQTGADSTTTIVKDIAKSDPCATGIANVQSIKSGAWDSPDTWSPIGVPDKDDWVIIKAIHTITMPEDMKSAQDNTATITGLCVKGTLQSAPNSLGLNPNPPPPTWVTLYPKTIHNQGTIRGADGLNSSGPWCKPNQYQHATAGSSIFLGYPIRFVNEGKILAGNGGTDFTWRFMNDDCGRGMPAIGGQGGQIEVNASIFTNTKQGVIKSGDGGMADRVGSWPVHGRGVGGDGGSLFISATNIAESTNAGRLESGSGGDAEIHISGMGGHAGRGGDTTVVLANQDGVIKGHNGSQIRIDPTTMKFGPNTRISGADVVNIFGGEDWIMEVTNLSENAITAAKQITFAVGKGGVIDFRGSAPNAIKAGVCTSTKALDIIYILDTSTSMQEKLSDGQQRIEAAKQAIVKLNDSIAQQNNGSRVALVTFDNNATVWSDFSSDIDSINEMVSQLQLHNYTRLHKGVDATTDLLSGRQNTENFPVVILFSDGDTSKSLAQNSLDSLKEAVPNALIHSVGIGEFAATSVLQYAVEIGGGQYYSTNDTASLSDALQQALTKSACPQATDDAEVRIFADQILLDEGVTLEKLISAPNIIKGPAKILYNATWSSVGYLENEPGITLAIPLTLMNAGPIPDTYAISVSDSAGWTLGELPELVTVNGLRRTELELEVTLPTTRGAQDVITVTAISQSDSTVKAKVNVQVGVVPEPIAEPEPEPEQVVSTYNASGTLLDKFGVPIINAVVQVGEKTTVTDSTGYWQMEGLLEGDYPITVIKNGYVFKTNNCTVGNNQDCQPRITARSELTVKVEPTPRTLTQGEDLTYLITVTNNGRETATDIVLTDVLPAGTELVSIESLDGNPCDTSTVTCSLPDLTPGATAQAKVVISNTQADKLNNSVEIIANEYPADIVKTWTTVKPYLSGTMDCTPNPVVPEGVLHCQANVELSHYAPSAATGIKWTMQLPTGVELEAINTDYGVCDTSQSPTITCELTDLSIEHADDLSHATIDVDMVLQDPGLLALTHETKVTATEYPAHTDRTSTNIFIPEEIEVDIAFVIDVTGSMQEEINAIIKALKEFIAQIEPSDAPLIALVTFRDEVKIKAFTRDLNVLLGAVEKLKASNGGTCPEASLEALLITIPHTKTNGEMLFATDASPSANAETEKVVEMLRSKGIRFNAIITGDCTQKDSWNELPSNE